MKRLLTLVAAAGLLLIPTALLAQSQAVGSEPPPISQTLVREGDFALDLAYVLKLGEPTTEAEAEDMLARARIAPENGWIADYPVTPDILAELEEAVLASAGYGAISFDRDGALKAFRGLALEYGLPVKPAGDESYAEDSGDLEYGDYESERVGDSEDYYAPEVIEEYYYVNDPPVVTYYSPPWDYYYLYSWVPYPFWWYSYYYPGYYVLNDFSVTVHHHHHRHHKYHKEWTALEGSTARLTNHVRSDTTGEVTRLDPATRKAVRAERRERRSIDRQRARTSFTDVKAAESIVNRGMTRAERRAERQAIKTDGRAERQAVRTDRQAVRSDRKAERQAVRNENRATRLGDGSRNRAERQAINSERRAERQAIKSERRAERQVERATRLGERNVSRQGATSHRQNRSFERATRLGEGNRSIGRSSQPRSADRSFDRPAKGGNNRTFSAPSRGGGNRSFDRPSKGGGFKGCRGGKC